MRLGVMTFVFTCICLIPLALGGFFGNRIIYKTTDGISIEKVEEVAGISTENFDPDSQYAQYQSDTDEKQLLQNSYSEYFSYPTYNTFNQYEIDEVELNKRFAGLLSHTRWLMEEYNDGVLFMSESAKEDVEQLERRLLAYMDNNKDKRRTAINNLDAELRALIAANNTSLTDPTITGTMYVDGDVGIGTSSPYATLTVDGDVAITGGLYDSTGSLGTDGYVLHTDGTNIFWVSTSSLGITGGGGGGGATVISDLTDVNTSGATTGNVLVYNGTTWVDQATSTLGITGGGGSGTVTSVAATVPTGWAVSGSPIVNAGTLAFSYDTGYGAVLTASTSEWATAYGWGDHSGSGYLTSVDMSDDTNFSVTATGLEESGDALALSAGYIIPLSASTTDWNTAYGWGDHSGSGYLTTVDISDDTNLTVGATGIERSGDDIALSAGYNIPLTASTSEWNTAYGWGDHSGSGYLSSVSDSDIALTAGYTLVGGPGNQAQATSSLFIRSDGRVGIGTQTPNDSLQISGGNLLLDNTQSIRAYNNSASINTLIAYTSSDDLQIGGGIRGSLDFRSSDEVLYQIDGEEVSRITNAGNYLIGTTTESARLVVQASTTDILNLYTSNGSETFTVLNSGNVGISTTTPQYGLSVDDDVALYGSLYDNSNSAGSNGYVLQSNGAGLNWVATSSLGISGASSFLDLSDTPGSFSANELLFMSGSDVTSDSNLVFSSGNLGIGSTSPEVNLALDGDFSITGAIYDNAYSRGTNGMVLQTTGSGVNWVATSSLGISGGGHDAVTLTGGRNYLTLSNQEITLDVVDVSDDTNLAVTATGIELFGDSVALSAGYIIPLTASTTEWATAYGWGDHSGSGYLTSVDMSDDTNFSVTATGLEESGDALALSAGYIIPLSASTTAWNNFYDTPSGQITAGDGLAWTSNTIDIDINELSTDAGFGTGDHLIYRDSGSGTLYKVAYDSLPGAGGGLTSLAGLTSASQGFATSSDTNIELAIVSSGSTHTFNPTWVGTLAPSRGGTGITSTSTLLYEGELNSESELESLLSDVSNVFTNNDTIDISNNTNLAVSGTGIELFNDSVTLSFGYEVPLSASTTEWATAYGWGDHSGSGYLTSVDMSDDTNFSVSATGLEESGDALALSAGYIIPLSASTTDWNTTYLWGDHSGSGYLTTVDISDDTNLTVGATGIERSGDDIALSAGYVIPLSASTTEWATAYGWGDHSGAGYLTNITGQALASLSDVNTTNVTTGNLLSYTGSGWATTSTSSLNINTDDLTEGSNQFYTDALARAAISETITGLTYTSGTGVFSLDGSYNIPLAASTTDWNTAFLWGDHSGSGYLSSVSPSDLSLTNGYAFRGSAGNTAEATSTLFIADNTFVGIGTTTPDQKLTVYGDIRMHDPASDTEFFMRKDTSGESALIYFQQLSSGTDWVLGSSDGGNHPTGDDFFIGRSKVDPVLYIEDSTGNIGIGTSSPASKLDVWGDFRVGTSSTPTLFTDVSTGYVGIGTNNPSYTVDIVGNIRASGNFRTSQFIDSDNSSYFINPSSGSVAGTFNGNVGIGSSSPARLLSVGGDAIITGALYDNNNSAGTYGMILMSTSTGFEWVATSSSALGLSNASLISFGTDNQIPVMNAGGTNFEYTNNFIYDGTDLNIGSGSGLAGLSLNNSPLATGSTTSNNWYFAGASSTSFASDGIYNFFFGNNSGTYLSSGDNNFAVGNNALQGSSTAGFSGRNNIAIGLDSMTEMADGENNIALGIRSLNTTNGYHNIGIGRDTLRYHLTNAGNIAIGTGALEDNVDGEFNASIGYRSMANGVSGSNNAALGHQALQTTTGNYNVAVGANSLFANDATGTIAIGYNAGDSATAVDRSIIIGYDVEFPSNTADDQLNIGNLIFGTDVDGTGTTLSSGNIGIGTTSPASKLDVWGDFRVGTSSTPLLIADTAGGGVGIGTTSTSYLLNIGDENLKMIFNNRVQENNDKYELGFDSSGVNTSRRFTLASEEGSNRQVLQFGDGSSGDTTMFGLARTADSGVNWESNFVVQADGDIGIGTSTPTAELHIAADSPRLYLSDNTALLGSTVYDMGLEFHDSEDVIVGQVGFVDNDDHFTIENKDSAGDIIFDTGDDLRFYTDNSQQMIVDSLGNVGIGVSGPSARLDVVTDSADEYAAEFTNSNADGLGAYIYVGNTDSDRAILDLENSSQNIFKVMNDGKVGIGTTTPRFKLQVSGAGMFGIATSSRIVMGSSVSAGETGVGLYYSSLYDATVMQSIHQGTGFKDILLNPGGGDIGINNTNPQVAMHVGSTSVSDSTNLLRLEDTNSTCNFTADSGSPSCGSDRTLKKNIEDIESELLTITQLNPVFYHWKTESENDPLQSGFIAQEVEEILPELVTEGTWIDGSERKFLNTGKMMPYVVGAISEQQLQLAQLIMTGSTTVSNDIISSALNQEDTFWSKLVELTQDFTDGVLSLVGIDVEVVYTKELHADEINTDVLCVGDTCITEIELIRLLNNEPVTSDSTNSNSNEDDNTSGGGSTDNDNTNDSDPVVDTDPADDTEDDTASSSDDTVLIKVVPDDDTASSSDEEGSEDSDSTESDESTDNTESTNDSSNEDDEEAIDDTIEEENVEEDIPTEDEVEENVEEDVETSEEEEEEAPESEPESDPEPTQEETTSTE